MRFLLFVNVRNIFWNKGGRKWKLSIYTRI